MARRISHYTRIRAKIEAALRLVVLLLFVSSGIIGVSAQEKLKFYVVDFDSDPFDLSAKDKQYEKYDGNGERYAIIKVTSINPDDNLSEYNFNFGNMKHIVEEHDGVLWLYVQRNAKLVTITRNGYIPINKYDLHTTIESGKNYVMSLTSESKKTYAQMVQFNVKPVDSRALIMVKSSMADSQEMLFGYIDANGSVAKSLEYGTYTYKVLAENYHLAKGRFTLNNRSETLIENVELKSNFSYMTFTVDADADIYVNGERKGTRQWKGALRAGKHQVECRQLNHKPSLEYIQVEDNDNRTINLKAPEPILGVVSVTSSPLGADIKIDGTSYGQTPKILDILTGAHALELSKPGYKSEVRTFSVVEDRSTDINVVLDNSANTTINSEPQNSKVYIDGDYKGNTPYIYDGAVGEHKIRLENKGYKTVSNKVYLGNTNQMTFTLNKMKVKPTDFYLGVGFGIGGETVRSYETATFRTFITYGGHIKSFNLEFSAAFVPLGEYSDYWYPWLDFDFKLGYGFICGSKFKITPQLGYRLSLAEVDNYDYTSEDSEEVLSSLTVGARVYLAFSRRCGVFATPEWSFGDVLGFNLKLGFSVTF